MKTTILFSVLILAFNFLIAQPTWQWASRGGGSDGDSSPNISEDEKIKDMAVDSQGNIYVTGRIRSNANINGTSITTYGGYDIFLAKFNCTGNLIWARTAGGNQDDESIYLALSNDGNIYITGRARSSPINTFYMSDTTISESTVDFFLAKYDTSGNFKWLRVASPGSSNIFSIGYGLKVINSTQIHSCVCAVTTGVFMPGYPVDAQKCYIAKFDNLGNLIALDSLGDFQMPFNYDQSKSLFTPNGDLYLSGTWQNSFTLNGTTYIPQGSFDLIVIKYNSDATLAWVYTQGYVNKGGIIRGMHIDDQDNIFITGSITEDFIFNNDTTQNSLAGGSFPFLAKLDSSGQALWGNSISTSATSTASGIAVDNNNNIYQSILLYGTGIFGSQNITSIGQSNSVLVKYDSSGNIQWAEMLNSTGGVEDQLTVLKPDNAGNIYLGGSFKNTVTINGNPTFSAGGKTDFLLVKHGGPSCTVGIEENAIVNVNYGIQAYPNPSTGKFLIRLEKFVPNQNNVVSVYNSIGQLIKEEKIKFPGIATIDITRVPSGIYHIRAFNGEKYMSTKVVVSE